MSIESGTRYTITNEESGLALDLYESWDNSIIGSGFHGGENQQVIAFAISIGLFVPNATTIPSSGS